MSAPTVRVTRDDSNFLVVSPYPEYPEFSHYQKSPRWMYRDYYHTRIQGTFIVIACHPTKPRSEIWMLNPETKMQEVVIEVEKPFEQLKDELLVHIATGWVL